LGRAEQGMSQALSVEKTSKRGGRIVHEKDRIMLPPPLSNPGNQFGESFKVPLQEDNIDSNSTNQSHSTPPSLSQCEDGSENVLVLDNQTEYGGLGNSIGDTGEYGNQPAEETPKPSITELIKNPSKVVLCKNMVGPGEVDDDLEPEVKEECNGKYGDVLSVNVIELPDPPRPEEAVRIFIEFKKVAAAIKAVIDLNGRFFGGREVKARFFDQDKFENLDLTD
jgi:splicing factor 45